MHNTCNNFHYGFYVSSMLLGQPYLAVHSKHNKKLQYTESENQTVCKIKLHGSWPSILHCTLTQNDRLCTAHQDIGTGSYKNNKIFKLKYIGGVGGMLEKPVCGGNVFYEAKGVLRNALQK